MSRSPYYSSNLFYKFKISIIPILLIYINRIIKGACIPNSCSIICTCMKFRYLCSSFIIYTKTVIKKNCLINLTITIGGTSKKYKVPVIGENGYIGGGTKILGNIVIGKKFVVDATSRVVEDIPKESIAVGILIKIIKTNIRMSDYV